MLKLNFVADFINLIIGFRHNNWLNESKMMRAPQIGNDNNDWMKRSHMNSTLSALQLMRNINELRQPPEFEGG